MEKLKNIPSLRFPEFKDSLEKSIIGQVANLTTGNKDTQNKIDDGEFPFFVRSQTIERINSYSFDGEAILTSGDGVGVGKNFHYINGKFDYHQRVYCLSGFNKNIIGKFVFYYFSENFNRRIMRMSAKNSVDSVRRDMIFEMEINIPSVKEQTKIATFLTAVDDKLQALKQKKTLLEQYKKGVMQKIFSQELRFKDDNGNEYPNWEEKKLGDICEIAKSGGTPTSTKREYYNGDIPFLSISDMTSQGKYLNYTSNHISELGLVNSSSWIVPANSIIYSMYASVGFVAINNIPLATSQAVLNLILKNSVNTDYIYYTLVDFQKKIAQFITTGTQGNLNAQSVKGFILAIPSLSEQTKIANFLSAIDDKINHCEAQIEKTEIWKKGLLQQMFV